MRGVGELADAIRREGYAIAEDLISPGEVAEIMPLAVSPELAGGYSERVQELLGYDIFEPTFVGYVDGMHPKRLLDAGYGSRRKGAIKLELPKSARPAR